MSEENPSQSEIKESINKLAKKMEQKIIEDARLKVESGFAEEPTTEEYWKAERLKVFDVQANNFNTEIRDVDLGNLTGEEWISPVFPPMMVMPMDMSPGAINGWVDLSKHLDEVASERDKRYTAELENRHLIITNRVLTILLIFSTAFGITAALAWLRCQ